MIMMKFSSNKLLYMHLILDVPDGLQSLMTHVICYMLYMLYMLYLVTHDHDEIQLKQIIIYAFDS